MNQFEHNKATLKEKSIQLSIANNIDCVMEHYISEKNGLEKWEELLKYVSKLTDINQQRLVDVYNTDCKNFTVLENIKINRCLKRIRLYGIE